MIVALLLPTLPGSALLSTTITLDGTFGDWVAVFDDPANSIPDPTGDQTDSNVDMTLAATTYDDTNVFFYTRRAASSGGGAAPAYYAWIDRGGDGRMHTGDMAIVFTLGGGNSFMNAKLYTYVAASGAAGDPMPGDAGWPAGTWGTEITALPASPYDGYGEPSGVQFEGRVSWTALGIDPGSAINVQCGSKLGSKTDSVGVASLVRRGVSAEPDRFSGAAAETTVTYSHTITNTGNIAATYNLTATSSKGWVTGVYSVGGSTLAQVTLAADETTDVVVAVRIPGTVPDGTKDTTVLTAADTSTGTSDIATDLTTVGSVLVVPDRSGSMAPGGAAVYRNTITNTTSETRTLNLTLSSTRSWPVEVRDTSNASTTQVVLGPGASTDVLVLVTVPDGTANGVIDVTTLQARDASAPSVRGSGKDTTTCAPRLSLEPNNAEPAGPGTTVTYAHVVANNWEDTRTVTLIPDSSQLWPVRLYDSDGTSQITTVTLTPQGGSRTIYVRVTIPPGTPAGVVDTTTVTAECGTDTDTATDVTTASRLVTYSNGGFSIPSSQFVLGNTVYVRAMGLASGTSVRVRWLRPNDTVAFTSNTIKADTAGVVSSSYAVASTEAIGMWKVVLLDSGGAEITRSTFWVGFNAQIDSVSVVGGDAIDSTITVSASLSNTGGIAIDGTVAHRIWWDQNADGVFNTGDSYVDSNGDWQGYAAGAQTHSASANVPAGSVYVEPGWGVTNRNLAYSGTYYVSTYWMSTTGVIVDQATEQFYAIPGTPWLQLTLSQDSIDFDTVDPGVPFSHSGVDVQVEANVAFDLIKSQGGSFAELGLSSSLLNQLNTPSGTSGYTDIVSVEAPWSTAPGAYSATLTYTVVVH